MEMVLLPPLATVSVNVVPTGKVRATAWGREKLNSVGGAEFGGVMGALVLVLKPLLAVSVTVTVRELGLLLPRRSHSRTGMAPALMENAWRSGGVMVNESEPLPATLSMVSVALVGTMRDRNRLVESRR